MCILDETDSGLDVDAMKLVAEGVNALTKPPIVVSWLSPTISGFWITSNLMWCILWPMAAS